MRSQPGGRQKRVGGGGNTAFTREKGKDNYSCKKGKKASLGQEEDRISKAKEASINV